MKVQDRFILPPERTPETVRDALSLFNQDMMNVANIMGGVHSQLDILNEGENSQDWQRNAIQHGLVTTLELCTEYLRKRIGDTEDAFMDALPPGKPAKKMREVKQ